MSVRRRAAARRQEAGVPIAPTKRAAVAGAGRAGAGRGARGFQANLGEAPADGERVLPVRVALPPAARRARHGEGMAPGAEGDGSGPSKGMVGEGGFRGGRGGAGARLRAELAEEGVGDGVGDARERRGVGG
jgi:hypothetical protein